MELISFEKRGQTGILKVNRPEALNALNRAVLEELQRFLSSGVSSENIRALIFTGEGKAFIAGADIKEMQALDGAGIGEFCELGQGVTNSLASLEMVTIAAVNGFALGGGLEMALACDFIYASTGAKLGQPEVTLGIIPGFGGTQRLSRAVGVRLAKELITTGRFLGAEEALRIGLVNKVVEAGIKSVVVVYDNDDAGEQGANDVAITFSENGIESSIKHLPEDMEKAMLDSLARTLRPSKPFGSIPTSPSKNSVSHF
ncbi:hypothetical protein LCGC14_2121730 [marine sediment metagenome]|uniref:3-hydroxybutyryl-CoA dehydratase n=1 Tax=marine sediment metagenome TaxID=412755 RepID=A0A0F9H0E1_9ZZZZ